MLFLAARRRDDYLVELIAAHALLLPFLNRQKRDLPAPNLAIVFAGAAALLRCCSRGGGVLHLRGHSCQVLLMVVVLYEVTCVGGGGIVGGFWRRRRGVITAVITIGQVIASAA